MGSDRALLSASTTGEEAPETRKKGAISALLYLLVRRTRLELVRSYPQASETCASANFATPANIKIIHCLRGIVKQSAGVFCARS